MGQENIGHNDENFSEEFPEEVYMMYEDLGIHVGLGADDVCVCEFCHEDIMAGDIDEHKDSCGKDVFIDKACKTCLYSAPGLHHKDCAANGNYPYVPINCPNLKEQ